MSYRNDFKDVKKEVTWTFWRVFWPVLGIFVLLSSIGFVFTMVSKPFQVIDQVTQPEKIIANYEWYRETWNDTQAMNEQVVISQQVVDDYLVTLPESRSEWSRADGEEVSRLQSVLLGLRNQRATVVADYNARSSMITRSLFKGSGVPAELKIVEDQAIPVWE